MYYIHHMKKNSCKIIKYFSTVSNNYYGRSLIFVFQSLNYSTRPRKSHLYIMQISIDSISRSALFVM